MDRTGEGALPGILLHRTVSILLEEPRINFPVKTSNGHKEKETGSGPSQQPEPRVSSVSISPDGKEQGIQKSPLLQSWLDLSRDVLELQFTTFSLSWGRGHGETLRCQEPLPEQPVRNKCSMRRQAHVSLSERTLFHGVILIKLSEPTSTCLQGFSLGNRLAGWQRLPLQ